MFKALVISKPISEKDFSRLVRDLELAFDDVYNTYGRFYEATYTWDPANLVDGAGETSGDIAVQEAVFGDYVLVAAPYDLQGILCYGYVHDTSVIHIRLQNETGGAIDLAEGVWKVRVIKSK